MRRGRSSVLFFAAVLATGASFAHEQKVALTDILYNERSGNLEIAHRFLVHDAEHTLRKATGMKEGLVESPEAQAAFAQYVAGRFALRLGDKSPLKLTLVGQELEGGYLWVYQETKLPEPLNAGFSIENRILQDVVKGQVNQVNVRYRSQVRTFVFEENAARKHYAGPEASNR